LEYFSLVFFYAVPKKQKTGKVPTQKNVLSGHHLSKQGLKAGTKLPPMPAPEKGQPSATVQETCLKLLTCSPLSGWHSALLRSFRISHAALGHPSIQRMPLVRLL
jgi:hypothetical protein